MENEYIVPFYISSNGSEIADDEKWRLISPDVIQNIIPNNYYISNYGNVYSLSSMTLLVPEKCNGYNRISLHGIKDSRLKLSCHRTEMIAFNPINNFDQLQVNHIDGNKQNNKLSNLEWCTAKENTNHAIVNGLRVPLKGEQNAMATISDDQANQICSMLEKGYDIDYISDSIGCSKHIIYDIRRGSSWKSISSKYNIQYKKAENDRFTDEELDSMCKYFEDNKNKYNRKIDLAESAIRDLHIESNVDLRKNHSGYLNKIFSHKIRKSIIDKYDF